MTNILTNLVEQQKERYGAERVALSSIDVDGGRLLPISWGEMAQRTDCVAHARYAWPGAGTDGGRILAKLPRDATHRLRLFLKPRRAPVAIYATSSAEQVQYIVNDAGARLIIVGAENHSPHSSQHFRRLPYP